MAKDNYQLLLDQLDHNNLPKHIGIIMDGNGRWAKLHHRPRLYGHRAGAKSVRLAVEIAVELELKCLTLYAFSTENWNRPKEEVNGLMKLLVEYMHKEINEINRQNVRANLLGSRNNVSTDLIQQIEETIKITENNTGLLFNVAFNYGGRIEIIEAIKKLHKMEGDNPGIISALTPDNFNQYLYTAGMPEPDLIIRTSGEMRLSNFLLWQSAYSELYITPVLWPDFNKTEFLRAIIDYQNRSRRFGKI